MTVGISLGEATRNRALLLEKCHTPFIELSSFSTNELTVASSTALPTFNQ